MDFLKTILLFDWMKGFRAIVAGIGLILYGIVLGIDSVGIDIPGVVGNWDESIRIFFEGLGILGIRLATVKR